LYKKILTLIYIAMNQPANLFVGEILIVEPDKFTKESNRLNDFKTLDFVHPRINSWAKSLVLYQHHPNSEYIYCENSPLKKYKSIWKTEWYN